MSYDITIVQGNVGKAPEMRYTPTGKAVTEFSVAVNRGFGETKKVVWFNVSAWEKLAETCNQYLKKGSKVLIQGNVDVHAWKHKDTSEVMKQLRMTAHVVRFLDSKPTSEETTEPTFDESFGAPPEDIPY